MENVQWLDEEDDWAGVRQVTAQFRSLPRPFGERAGVRQVTAQFRSLPRPFGERAGVREGREVSQTRAG